MEKIYYDPLSDLSRIKESLISCFCHTEDIMRLVTNCFSTPYRRGAVTDGCAVFMETSVTKAETHLKEVRIDLSVVCHKDSLLLSEEDTEYCHGIGIYGNRVDSAVQAIHSAITDLQTMESLKKEYAIGNLHLSSVKPMKPHLTGTDFYGKVISFTYPSFYRRKN